MLDLREVKQLVGEFIAQVTSATWDFAAGGCA